MLSATTNGSDDEVTNEEIFVLQRVVPNDLAIVLHEANVDIKDVEQVKKQIVIIKKFMTKTTEEDMKLSVSDMSTPVDITSLLGDQFFQAMKRIFCVLLRMKV